MVDVLCADMFTKNLISPVFSWYVFYDYKSLEACPDYDGPVSLDYYGRLHPSHSGGTVRTRSGTNSVQAVLNAMLASFDAGTDHRLLFRRLSVCANEVTADSGGFQVDLFTDYKAADRERRMQGAMLEVRKKLGPNAVFKGINMLDGATTLERNQQIGGHRA